MRRSIFAAAWVVVCSGSLLLAAEPVPIHGANYPLAQKFTREFVGTLVHEASVSPQWIGKTDLFWYSIKTPDGMKYWKVDPERRTKEPLFDQVKFAAQLSEAIKKPLEPGNLPINRPKISDDGKVFSFQAGENLFEYTIATDKLVNKGKPQPTPGQLSPEALDRMRQQLGEERVREMLQRMEEQNQQNQNQQQQQDQQQQTQQQGNRQTPPAGAGYKAQSPDKKKYVFAMKHNLYLAEEGKEAEAVQLTKDGVELYSFAGGPGGAGGGQRGNRNSDGSNTNATATATPAEDRKTRPNVTWSPDSKGFYVQRTDNRGVKDLYLVDSIAQPRPKLEQYAYPMPGEEQVRKSELFVCDVESKKLTKIAMKWKDERYSNLTWGKTADDLRVIRRDRLQRNLEVCLINAKTAEVKCQILESFDSAFLDFQTPRAIEETGEFIWWSERSGWGHYYLYGADGKLKNALTSGNWRASRIVDVDVKAKQVYIAGNAREPGENPYFQHLYRVNFDGSGLTLLDPSLPLRKSTSTSQPDPRGFNQTSYLSSNKKFVVTTSSRIDAEPFSTVRDDSGQVVMELETTDLTRLKAAGWKHTQTFSVKAADGTTDLYGNMWLPFDFDPNKKYPIIAYVYPGPQMEGTTHRFTAYSTYMQLAQLGVIVIQCGHRGGSPERSKAYHSFGYFNLRDYGLVDKKAAIEQLASRHAYIDLERVGIYGHSGGGFMSAAALLQPPYNTFFKAAVASAGNHDNNIYNDNWSERYHGMKEVPVDAKGTTSTTENTTGATQRGTGTGTGTGQGRRRPPVEISWDDLAEVDPDGQMSDDEKIKALELKIREMQKAIDDAKKDIKGTETKTEQKTEVKKEEKKEEKKDEKKEEKKDEKKEDKKETKEAVKTKFEIIVPTNAELAANLKGHLLLVHGEIDNNVHPANTMRLVDALIKANKRFDMLIIPGARHAFGSAQPYFTQKMWDFFAEHLLNDRQTNADILEKETKRK